MGAHGGAEQLTVVGIEHVGVAVLARAEPRVGRRGTKTRIRTTSAVK